MSWSPRVLWLSVAGLLIVTLGIVVAVTRDPNDVVVMQRRMPPAVSAAPVPATVPAAAPAPSTLKKISYWGTPSGFPRDPAPDSLEPVKEGLRPHGKVAVYDAPGGKARAFLPTDISGLPVTVPIVARRPGWVAVLLPSVNRRVGWLPLTSGDVRPLHDQLIVDLSDRRLTWLRDGQERGSWEVSIGSRRTPTPLGRTYVMGHTITSGRVYAGEDAIVLGAVPDDKDALSASLRNGHTAIHAWSDSSAFGRDISNGCIRLPAKVQRTLLKSIGLGAVVHVVE
ncbi:L,D-transpeptidase [Actinoplanes solisilvae]|uniref:L,D-transpeptidase n=1 Tax=Actinoplanes solisilvae TaxID=2486853 RepID=UPI001F0BA5D5|nr:L,D-transpeptidase [Actinoplanes solisilvae]